MREFAGRSASSHRGGAHVGKPQLEAETCDVAVTPDRMIFTAKTAMGRTLAVAIPREAGEELLREIGEWLEAMGEEASLRAD